MFKGQRQDPRVDDKRYSNISLAMNRKASVQKDLKQPKHSINAVSFAADDIPESRAVILKSDALGMSSIDENQSKNPNPKQLRSESSQEVAEIAKSKIL